MKATQGLHDLGHSLWLDNITRGLLTKGTLRRYITELSVTGLTSNPTILIMPLKIPSSTTMPSGKRCVRENRGKRCSSNLP